MHLRNWAVLGCSLLIGTTACSHDTTAPHREDETVLAEPPATVNSAVTKGVTGQIERFAPDGTLQSIVALPLAGPPPQSLSETVTAAKRYHDHFIAMGGRIDPGVARSLRFAEDLIGAQDEQGIRTVVAPHGKGLTHRRNTDRMPNGRIRQTSVFSRNGSDFLRFTVESPQPPAPAQPDGEGGEMMEVAMDIDICEALDPYSDQATWPSECVPGYDPYYDSFPIEQDVAAMQAQAAMIDAEMTAFMSAPSGSPEERKKVIAAEMCRSYEYGYYASIGAFVWNAGSTIFWGAGMRNPARAFESARNAAASLVAINVTRAAWMECMWSNGYPGPSS